MLLDYIPSTDAFALRVMRNDDFTVKQLMEEYGFDRSAPRSNVNSSVLFTKQPYAAAPFVKYATPHALEKLLPITTQIDASRRPASSARIACPCDQELWPFQKASVEYALKRQHCLIADQPGLGKTMSAICIANEMRAKRVLVLCPANIRLQWQRKIREWTTMSYPYVIYPILSGAHGVHPIAEWTIVSYDLARTPAIGAALAKGYYDLLILDEAHYLKTIDSLRTRTTFGRLDGHDLYPPLASRAEHILALTGTPLPNRAREAYTIARGLDWGCIDWMSEDAFRCRFNPSMARTWENPITHEIKTFVDERSGRSAELQARLRANIMARHMKRDVMTQLQLPELDIVLVEETSAIKQALKAESLLDFDPEKIDINDIEIMGALATVRRMMGVAKAPLAAEYVDMTLKGGEDKVVVFGWHIEVLDILQRELRKYGVARVDGSTSAVARQAAVDRFVGDPSVRVFLGNIQSVGIGTDGLQRAASHAIFAECSWVPGENEQATDRLDRGGQENVVQADFLVAPGSLDEKILGSSIRKKRNTHQALDAEVK